MPRRSHPGVPAALALLAFAVALLQRPGRMTFDTKVDLHVDPWSFLGDVASTWSATTDLGHVQGGQYAGYLFPMGPFFAAGHGAGLPEWLVHRLWLGLLLALAAWGTVRLLDALWSPRRGVAHAVAGAAIVLNPYVVVFANRTSVTLLAYAALPWLLLCVHRGLRDPRGWRWPAAFALVVAASGGGVNAAVVGLALLGPALLAGYEAFAAGVRARAVGEFAWRTVALTAAGSLWWIVPVLVQAVHGIDFLAFIEQPGTIWATTSASEAIRLMGYWTSYTGVSFAGPPLALYGGSATMLFDAPVVVATLLVPALAFAGLAWTGRRTYAPFFLALALLGVLVVMAGFPEGTPLRRALTFTYNHVDAVQFLRTTYKAAPLAALGIALLLGTAAEEAWRRLAPRLPAPRALAAGALSLALVALLALSAWPLARGRGVELTSDGVPAGWRDAARDVDRRMTPNRRAVVLPGQLFAFYRWGGTVDPILPVLAERPVTVRGIVPYGDLHATDLLWTLDRLVQQRRLYPGQLAPLLRLIGTGTLVSGTDDDPARSGALAPALAARDLAAQGFAAPDRAHGRVRGFAAPLAAGAPAVSFLPRVRGYDVAGSRGLVRVAPAGAPVVVDGSAEALAGLAALGGLSRERALRYAGDLPARELRAAAAAGAEVVVSDTNRRRIFVNSLQRQNLGWTLAPGETVSEDAAMLDPFPDRGDAARTVARYGGIRYVRAPFSPGLAQFPERRPFAALDGDPATAWLSDRNLHPDRRWIEVGLTRRRDVAHLDLLPHGDARGRLTAVEVDGRTYRLAPGWNRLAVGLRGVNRVRVRMARMRLAPGATDDAGGLRELRIPGVRASEALRVPRLAEEALAGRDLRRTGLTYLLSRTTGDDPLRAPRVRGPLQDRAIADRGDAETGLRRLVRPPAARAWRARAWASVSPAAPDSALDRLAGYRGRAAATSSSRYGNAAAFRASSAFDGDPRSAWIAQLRPGASAWIAWRGPRPVTLRRLTLVPPARGVPVPATVRVAWPRGVTPRLAVGRGGGVELPRPVRTRVFRLEVLRAREPVRGTVADRTRAAVAIAELRADGLARMEVPRRGPLASRCGSLTVRAAGRRIDLRVTGDVADLDRRGALRARSCGGAVRLPAGPALVTVPDGDLRVDWLALRSPAPRPPPPDDAAAGGTVVDPGRHGRASVDGVRLDVAGPSWLVLGQSFNRGWRAWCGERELGPPRVIDGYANGWRIDSACRSARFAFAPNRTAHAAYAFSALAVLVLLVLLVAGRRRREGGGAAAGAGPGAERAGPGAEAGRPRAEPAGPARWPLRRALAAGLAAGAVLGFVFALRAGVVIAPAVALVLWRGVGALVLAAAALVGIVVPALYVLRPARDRGGFNFEYAVHHMGAHWVAVAALTLLLLALGRMLAARRRALSTARTPSPGRAPAAAPEPSARP